MTSEHQHPQPEPAELTDEELRELRRKHDWPVVDSLLFSVARAVIAAEREACARICDKQYERARTSTGAARADACATAIRSRRSAPEDPIVIAARDETISDAEDGLESQPVPVTEQNRDLFEDLSVQWQRERAETQMTLGKLIETLEAMPAGAMVEGLHDPHSYRGYYEDLALARTGKLRLAVDLLDDCRAVMGKVLRGYKGGSFLMYAATPVWVASYGNCGEKLITLDAGGRIETKPLPLRLT